MNPVDQIETANNEVNNEVPRIRKRPFLFDIPHMIYRRVNVMLANRSGKLDGVPLNISWVTPNLAVGGRFPVEAAEAMAKKLGITHIVDVRKEERDDEKVLCEHGITLLHLPTIDTRAVAQEMLEDGVAWVNQQLADGGKVYIHCQYGIGRSVLLACCVLVSMGYSAQEALRQVKQKRPQAAPNQEQLDALVKFARNWRKQFGGFSGDTITDLKAIAYSDRATLNLERQGATLTPNPSPEMGEGSKIPSPPTPLPKWAGGDYLQVMKILCVDVGTGTQDVLLFDSEQQLENCVQLVLPAPTVIVADRIKAATAQGAAVLLEGVTMGGGPLAWAAEAHLRAGLPLYATAAAARTLDDDLEAVAAMGVQLVGSEQAAHMQNVTRIRCRDFYLEEIVATLVSFGAATQFDGLAVAVFDHGAAPPGYSDRRFRFDYLTAALGDEGLIGFAHRRSAVPSILTRLQAVAESLPREVRRLPLLLMDTAPAAALGMLEDPLVREAAYSAPGAILLNVGNFHTLAFMVSDGRIMGLFEHHTGEIDATRLAVYLSKLASGSLSNDEIFNSKGHGALILQRPPAADTPPLVAATGPRRAMIAGNWANLHFPAPHGSMMMTGCYGLLRGYAHRYPEAAAAINRRLSPSPLPSPLSGKGILAKLWKTLLTYWNICAKIALYQVNITFLNVT